MRTRPGAGLARARGGLRRSQRPDQKRHVRDEGLRETSRDGRALPRGRDDRAQEDADVGAGEEGARQA